MKYKLSFFCLFITLLTACDKKPNEYFSGYAEAEYIRISSPTAGSLTRLNLMKGQIASKGTAAFTLEQESEIAARAEAQARLQRAEATLADVKKGKRPDEIAALNAQLAQANAAQKLSNADLIRKTQLVTSKFLSPAVLDEARASVARDLAQVKAAQAQIRLAIQGARTDQIAVAEQDKKAALAQLAQADWNLSRRMQQIPVDAVVNEIYYREGELVPAGSPVLSLLAAENIKARFFVPQAALASLRLGQTVQLQCDGCGAPIPAQISYVSPNAEYTSPIIYSKENRANLVFMLEAKPSAANAMKLHPGMPLEVRLPSSSTPTSTSTKP
jgi:HlyD family secretion protein